MMIRSSCLSDIFPTVYFGAEIAEIVLGDTVVIFGCGPVGQFAIASAHLMGAAMPTRLMKQQASRLRGRRI